MSNKTLAVTDRIHDYLLRTTVREPAVLAELREETMRLPMARMQIAPEQGQLMGLLVELCSAKRAIEVGVFTGYSAIAVALALPDDGRLIACDVNEEWTSIARRYFGRAGVEHKIELRLRPALETLDELLARGQAGTFDFAFIDADKENYAEYYERCLSLLRVGGLVAVDNALWSGDVADPEKDDAETQAIRALNQKVAADPRVTMSLLPIGDGLLLARKR
ncbi:MAG: class I SAM-dependent methyltransferase [Polyangiaceae bacterium]|nr:class I SAM-dependent methyltransferase [Polyangiaceae bacterium]MCE7894451.1 SAM-dependent methyltransferase [Sorangiineae bacterium PRO1]